MAKLISDNFTWDIQFANYSNGAINYHIKFEYGKKAILNPLITDKKYFIVQEFKGDYLISVLEKALEITIEEDWEYFEERLAHKKIFWVPNSSMVLIINPYFDPGWQDTRNPEEKSAVEQLRLKGIDELRDMGAQFSGDPFILDFFIYSNGLKKLTDERIDFPDNAVRTTIRIKRATLRKFLSVLRKEYRRFCKKFKVKELGGKAQKFLEGKEKSKEISNLEKQFDQEMRRIYWEARELGMCGDGFIASIEERRGRDAAKFLLAGSDDVSGAEKLRFYQMFTGKGLELTAEYLVAQPRWAKLFTKEEIKEAKRRLKKWR